ncbi:adenylyl-sulfate kinase [Yimella lutea]|uniref:adenylyl-sulfate kinase n=1 Tax=Yimella lutea TaxID=587872 RepID=A0A542EE37_9MICO|nr:adenylyl-sulfate kinase [Yimella lutea]TQJ13601.1 adenylyl-sulfate kinase [Yimella lutea]
MTAVRLSAEELDELMLVRDGFCSVSEVSLPSFAQDDEVVDLEGAVVARFVEGEFEFADGDSRPFAWLYGQRRSSSEGALATERDRDQVTPAANASTGGRDLVDSPVGFGTCEFVPHSQGSTSGAAQGPTGGAVRGSTSGAVRGLTSVWWIDGASERIAELAEPGALLVVPMSPSHQPGHRALAALRSAIAAAREREDLRVLAVPVDLDAHPERRELLERALDADSSSTISDHEASSAAGVFILLTGLSGSGKSTIARALREELIIRGRSVTLLDGDQVRRELSAGLGFSPEDRDTNVRRIGWVGAEIAAHGGAVVACPIAPYDATRKAVRQKVEHAGARMVLVHVATPLAECERRDRKGLYAKARAGELPDFTGISAPYEAPEDADLVIDTSEVAVADAVARIVTELDR